MQACITTKEEKIKQSISRARELQMLTLGIKRMEQKFEDKPYKVKYEIS